jgi:tRNA 2-thiouridine synthesizing protein E
MMSYTYEGRIIEADDEGFLTSAGSWSPQLALQIAQRENIRMGDDHWEVVNFLRNYYMEYQITPGMRVLIKALGKVMGPDKGNSKYLYELFPDGPVRQAAKIAGLPKPTNCM